MMWTLAWMTQIVSLLCTQDDYEGVWNVVAFLLAFVCCVLQVKFTFSLQTEIHPSPTLSDSMSTTSVSTVPPLPVPFFSEEAQVLHSVDCDCPMQPLPARPEEPLAADLPHVSFLPLHHPHPHPQTPRQNQWLRGLRSRGHFTPLHHSQLLQCRWERQGSKWLDPHELWSAVWLFNNNKICLQIFLWSRKRIILLMFSWIHYVLALCVHLFPRR